MESPHLLERLYRQIESRLLPFLTTFFIVVILSYSVLYFLDLVPEPTTNNVIDDTLLTSFGILIILGTIAGIVQFIGYVIYYIKSVRDEIQPNPTTWLMFGYGTLLLLVMEWDSNAELNLLILPLVCSLCGIGIAVIVYHKEHLKARARGHTGLLYWPDTWKTTLKGDDGWSFKYDLILTVLYSMVWIVTLMDFISLEAKAICVVVFLFISNLTTFTEFAPLIRQTRKDPRTENSIAWFIWTGSYGLLLIITLLEPIDGMSFPVSINPLQWEVEFWQWLVLLMYPAINMYYHFLVGWLARPSRLKTLQVA